MKTWLVILTVLVAILIGTTLFLGVNYLAIVQQMAADDAAYNANTQAIEKQIKILAERKPINKFYVIIPSLTETPEGTEKHSDWVSSR